MTFSELLASLNDVMRVGGSYLARCPSHADTNPSLLLTLEPSGRLLIFCRARCHRPRVDDLASPISANDAPDTPSIDGLSTFQHFPEQAPQEEAVKTDPP